MTRNAQKQTIEAAQNGFLSSSVLSDPIYMTGQESEFGYRSRSFFFIFRINWQCRCVPTTRIRLWAFMGNSAVSDIPDLQYPISGDDKRQLPITRPWRLRMFPEIEDRIQGSARVLASMLFMSLASYIIEGELWQV